MKIIIAILSLTILTACHSVGLRKSNKTFGTVYLATTTDISLLPAWGSSDSSEQVVGVLGAMSLPFDLVADTIFLPYDVYNIRKSSEFISYGKSGWREYQLDSQKKPCKTLRYQMKTYQFREHTGNYFSGHANFKDGVLDGETKAWWSRDKVYFTGEYKNGSPWDGTILLGAADPYEMIVGPLNTYENGILVGISNIVINLETVK